MDTPQFYHDNGPAAEKNKAGDHFVVEEFLDFSNDDDAAPPFDVITPDSVLDNNSVYDPNFIPDVPAHHAHFSSDLCVPYDDIADMEWLSNIVEDSFSSEDLQRLQLISGVNARSAETTNLDDSSETANVARMNSLLQSPDHDHDHEHEHDQHVATSVPGKARSKRSRAPPCNWSSRLLLVSASSSETGSSSPEVSESSAPPPPPMAGKKGPKKKEAGEGAGGGGEGRRCVHCATDKTPQWRTGPMGPKTLCNACGVRYKSGRLVPEYRPAASPTFVLTKHSNSHRKVLELRRQKDFVRAHHHHQFIPNNNGFDHRHHGSAAGEQEYLIHHHTGPDYRQIIYD